MLALTQLLLPLLVSAVAVFIASSLIHMVIRWHASDFRPLANEDEVADALRRGGAAPGVIYALPHCTDMKQMQTPEMQKKLAQGPHGFVALWPPGVPSMGKPLAQWFVLTLFVSAVAASICSAALGPGAAPGRVFHVAGLVAFAAYATGGLLDGIWHARPWGVVAKDLLDAAIYAALTGASFALLWPTGV